MKKYRVVLLYVSFKNKTKKKKIESLKPPFMCESHSHILLKFSNPKKKLKKISSVISLIINGWIIFFPHSYMNPDEVKWGH